MKVDRPGFQSQPRSLGRPVDQVDGRWKLCPISIYGRYGASSSHNLLGSAAEEMSRASTDDEVKSYNFSIFLSRLQRAVSLLQLSERYAMHGLSLFCCEALSKNLTVDTVCKIAAVAEQHSLRDLKEKAVS